MGSGIEWVLVAGIVGSLGYWASLWLWPLKRCPRCNGERRIHGHGTVRRVCGRCNGTGEVRRLGARKEE